MRFTEPAAAADSDTTFTPLIAGITSSFSLSVVLYVRDHGKYYCNLFPHHGLEKTYRSGVYDSINIAHCLCQASGIVKIRDLDEGETRSMLWTGIEHELTLCQ